MMNEYVDWIIANVLASNMYVVYMRSIRVLRQKGEACFTMDTDRAW